MKKSDISCNELWRAMFRIVDCMREQQSGIKDKMLYRLTYNQLRMIRCVYVYKYEKNEIGISLKVLAEQLGITPAAASEMVDTLVNKGVLTRTPDPRDRRAIAISVSDELQKRIFSSEDGFDRVTSDFLATLSSEDQVNFIRTVNLWAEFAKQRLQDDKRSGK